MNTHEVIIVMEEMLFRKFAEWADRTLPPEDNFLTNCTDLYMSTENLNGDSVILIVRYGDKMTMEKRNALISLLKENILTDDVASDKYCFVWSADKTHIIFGDRYDSSVIIHPVVVITDNAFPIPLNNNTIPLRKSSRVIKYTELNKKLEGGKEKSGFEMMMENDGDINVNYDDKPVINIALKQVGKVLLDSIRMKKRKKK